MKKYLSLMIVSIIAALPLVVKADKIDKPICSDDESGITNCVIPYEVGSKERSSLTITITEHGGAEVTNISTAMDSQWEIGTKSEEGNVWTVVMTHPGISNDEGNLLAFSYKKSTQEGCKVTVSLTGANSVTTKDEENPDPENPQTGSTLPYIALGSIALIAAGAYVTTRNKSKVYKI